MRVVLLSEVLGVGGLPNYVLELARVMSDAGMTVLVAHGNAPLPEHLAVAGLTMMHLPGLAPGAGGAAVDCAMAALRSWCPDLVHVHLCGSPTVLRRLLDSGLVLVRSFHDLTSLCLRRGRRRWRGDRCQRALGWSCAAWGCLVSPPRTGSLLPRFGNLPAKLAERNGYRSFDANIACSNFMAQTLQRNGFPAARIHVVPSFSCFDTDATAFTPPAKLPGIAGRDRPFEMLFSGQAVTGKGLEILIAALSGLEGDWRLSVLAEGPRLASARTMAAQAGLSSRIRFLGWLPQSATRDHYRTADLVVMASIIDEILPLVGIEAMSLGTPLVGFAVGGVPDYLLDDETGLLVAETTPDALRAALARAIANPARVSFWGAAARRLSARTHTRTLHLAALRRIYEGATGRTTASVTHEQWLEAEVS